MENNNFERLILDTFGTKELCARKMNVSRWTIYRWIENPDIIQAKYLKKLSFYTKKSVVEILNP
jgi:hypothetical protein